ncbi:MAG: DUF421 domain-containing protein [Actinomycetota bacterium]
MTPLLEVVGRTLAVYVAIVVGLRIVGKRQLGQLTVPDLVVVLLVANAVQNAMVGADVSLEAGLVSAATLLVANLVVTRLLVRSPGLARLVTSPPTVLVKDGVVLVEALRREGIDEDELRTALREHGVEDPASVRVAYLEPDGAVSVIPIDARIVRTRHRVRRQRDR